VGNRIWALSEKGACLEFATQRIVREYDITPAEAMADVRAFVESLVCRNFLVPEAAEIRPNEN
jgi:hypothetical protein